MEQSPPRTASLLLQGSSMFTMRANSLWNTVKLSVGLWTLFIQGGGWGLRWMSLILSSQTPFVQDSIPMAIHTNFFLSYQLLNTSILLIYHLIWPDLEFNGRQFLFLCWSPVTHFFLPDSLLRFAIVLFFRFNKGVCCPPLTCVLTTVSESRVSQSKLPTLCSYDSCYLTWSKKTLY